MTKKYEVRCSVGIGKSCVETVVSRHRTEKTGRRQCVRMSRLLPVILAGKNLFPRVWLLGPDGKVVDLAAAEPEPKKKLTQAESDAHWAEWTARTTAIDIRVEAACMAAGHETCHVDYSAYGRADDDLPVDNLNEIAAHGRVVLIADADDFFGGPDSEPYRSEVLEDPTWLQVAVCANKMIETTRDGHHVFLEGLHKSGKEGDVTVYEFVMGS